MPLSELKVIADDLMNNLNPTFTRSMNSPRSARRSSC